MDAFVRSSVPIALITLPRRLRPQKADPVSSPRHSSLRGVSPPLDTRMRSRAAVRMGAVVGGEEDEARQAKEMAAARRRWETLIREEKVKVLTPREAGYAIQLSNKTLLDVRPSTEHNKAWVKGSAWIPIFDADNTIDIRTLSKKITNFVMGGWWSGITTLVYDKSFITKVEKKFPKDTDLIVACQKGLRKGGVLVIFKFEGLHDGKNGKVVWHESGSVESSRPASLAACEQLYNAGFRNLFWVQGGLEAAEEEDFQREGPQPFKLAGIGGVSEYLGWTDQQRAIAAKEGWGYRFVFTGRLIGLLLLADALFLGAQKVGPLIQELRAY